MVQETFSYTRQPACKNWGAAMTAELINPLPGDAVPAPVSAPPPLVVEVTGALGHAEGRRLAELLHGLPVDGRSVEVHLPDTDGLPANALAACVYLASRVRSTGGRLTLVAGIGVARTVARARLSWLLPVTAKGSQQPGTQRTLPQGPAAS